jgi:large subunit ribosomal protein L18
MKSSKAIKTVRREARHLRVRKTVRGTAERPRLAVFRSSKHISAQLIDDDSGRSIAAVSTLNPGVREQIAGKKKSEAARIVGLRIAELAKAHGVEVVRFDRGGFLFHGRVKAVADGAREGGLKF